MADPVPVPAAEAGPVVITLPAEIDAANGSEVREQLYSALATGVAVVVADMTVTTFCDTLGVRALVMAHQQAKAGNVELRLAIPSASVMSAMTVMGLDGVLGIYPSLDAALAGRPMW
jgi:anti-sigma B factor antagonist